MIIPENIKRTGYKRLKTFVLDHATGVAHKDKYFNVYISTRNSGKRVQCKATGEVHDLTIAYEGINYYHLGAREAFQKWADSDMVLKKDYTIVNKRLKR